MLRPLALLTFALAACGGMPRVDIPLNHPEQATMLARFERMPSGVARWNERTFLAFPRWAEEGSYTLAEWTERGLVPFPSAEAHDVERGPSALHSVNGIHVDRHGRLWILDNGRVQLGPADEGVPKIVVWDLASGREAFRVEIGPQHAPPAGSFLNDIVVDEDHGFAYVTESGIGGTPALLVIEIARERIRRVLEGHPSVLPDPERELLVDGEPAEVTLGGVTQPWRVAVNAIGLSADGAVLYFGPLTGELLYEIDTRALRDATLDASAVASAVQVAGGKPFTDGMSVDAHGRWVFTDLERGAIVLGDEDGDVRVCSHPDMSFPVGVEPVADGGVYATSAPLHEMPMLHEGDDRRDAPYALWFCAFGE